MEVVANVEDESVGCKTCTRSSKAVIEEFEGLERGAKNLVDVAVVVASKCCF